MRIFIDTNILISAALFSEGVASKAYFKAVSTPNDPIISDYVIDELMSVFRRKFPSGCPHSMPSWPQSALRSRSY